MAKTNDYHPHDSKDDQAVRDAHYLENGVDAAGNGPDYVPEAEE